MKLEYFTKKIHKDFPEFSPERIAGKNDWGFGGKEFCPPAPAHFPPEFQLFAVGEDFLLP